MKEVIRKNIVAGLALTVLLLIVFCTLLVVHNREVMSRTSQQQELNERTLIQAKFILNNLQAIDLGLRGYAITRSENHFKHYQDAIGLTKPAFEELERLLMQQNYQVDQLQQLKKAMAAYTEFCNKIIEAVKREDTEQVRQMVIQDKGYEAWSVYQDFYQELDEFEKGLTTEARSAYNRASSSSIWAMLMLLAVSLPTLVLIVYLLRKAERKRRLLMVELEQNNRQYNFDSGEPADIKDEYQLINGFIENSKKAAELINQVAKGEYDIRWEGLNEQNASLNQSNLAGALIKMRDQMKSVKEEEEKRLWVTRGLAEFSELIRNHQENIESLAYETVVFLVKYFKAQQGGLFLVHTDEGENTYLELAACYAFDRKKFIKKRIEVGEGLIGQTYLEADTVFLTEIPEGYTLIRSGLGDATPKCLLLVPMKYNDEVRAVIEIAGFNIYEPYQIEFMEKVGEFVASAVASVQNNLVTRKLLEEAQSMAEEMKSQEEEMRQNMEELSATQEEMHRKEQEYINRIQELEENAGMKK
jgi:CHASE3 domain sensor protein